MRKRGFCQSVAKHEEEKKKIFRQWPQGEKEWTWRRKKKQIFRQGPLGVNLTKGENIFNHKTCQKSIKENLPTRLNKYSLPCNRFRLSAISVFIRLADRLS